jgi:hypothetical protein
MSNKKHPGGRPPAKILTDNFTGPEKLITSLVEKYGNAIIALQLAAMVNALKDKMTSLPISARTRPLKTLAVTLFSIVQA